MPYFLAIPSNEKNNTKWQIQGNDKNAVQYNTSHFHFQHTLFLSKVTVHGKTLKKGNHVKD